MRTLVISVFLFGSVGTGAGVPAQAQSPPRPAADAWSVDAVVVAALAQHPLVEAAKAQLSAAEGRRQTARTLPNPVATYWAENLTFPGGSSGVMDRESSIYATLPLEPFLQRDSRLAQAGADFRAAEAAVASAEQRVAADAVHAFYRVALAQAAVEALRDNLAAIEQVVVYLRNRVAQGAAPEGDLIRAEVERDRAEAEVTMADVELLRAQSVLRPFLGDALRISDVRVTAADWTGGPPTLAPLTEFTTHALSHRTDLAAGRARIEAASGALALERSMIVRQLGASFGMKRTGGASSMVGGISLSVPLFDRNRGEIKRAAGERLAMDLETHWMERTIASEVEAEYLAAERLTARVTLLQPTFLRRAEESRQIAISTYQEGATTLLQVLDASRALNEARLTYARVLAAASESLFDLGIAAGYDAKAAARLGRGSAAPGTARPDGGSR